MPPAARLLQTTTTDPGMPHLLTVDSNDVGVILAALLCALIGVVGLALVARSAWLLLCRRSSNNIGSGLKKKSLQSLPKVTYNESVVLGGGGGRSLVAECSICLAEFEEGEEIRILPQCGHSFHVECVDTWLGSHSSCPSCRRVLVV